MAGDRPNDIVRGLLLGGVVLVAGLAIGGYLVWSGVSGMTDSLTQVAVPGSQSLDFDEPGTHYIFYEHESALDGRTYSTSASFPDGLVCQLTSDTSGQSLSLKPAGSMNYSLGSRQGVALYEFEVGEPGAHTLMCDYAEGYSGPEVVLAAGKNIVSDILVVVFGALTTCGLTALLLIVILIVTIVKHGKSKRADTSPHQMPV